MSMQSRTRLLKTAAAVTMFFGFLIGAAALPALNLPTAVMLDMVFPPMDGAEVMTASATRLLAAIAGGVLAGWGLMAWIVASEVLPTNPALARRLVLPSIGLWFVIDSSMSVAAGAPLNALLNTGFLIAFALPVLKLDKVDDRYGAAHAS